ncbi:MAG: polymer-forming cytoskeletal protein [Ruminiclostridium sp.]
MGIKDNFSQAMKELVNPKESDQRKEVKDVAAYMNDTADAGQSVPNPAPQAEYSYQQTSQAMNANTANSGFSQSSAQDLSQRIARDMNEQSEQNNAFAQAAETQNNTATEAAYASPYSNTQHEQPTAPEMPEEPSETTVISKNTTIDGNIRSFANMKIDGSIKGNVETTKNIVINGKVVGDLTCDNINMRSSAVQGNIRLKGQAVMANDSMLIGDLSSQIAHLNGKIKGNINASGKLMLDKDSVIIGDIKAGSVAISDGAVINGYITTTYLSKDESANIFPENIALGE